MLVLLALSGLAACDIRYPNTGVEIADERPTIAFRGAPAGSQVFVDGVAMGPADEFDGQKVLLVEPGMHVVQVRHKGGILLSERVFLGEGAKRTFVVQ
jgi:hypothetical protein